MIAIQTHDLTKKFKERIAVNSLNFSIEKGELFALLGTNGAGKSTTIKMLSCLSKPTSGDAILLGSSILTAPFDVKQKINVSPQETAIAPNLTVRENLELVAGIYGCNKTEAKKKQQRLLNLLTLVKLKKIKARFSQEDGKEGYLLQLHL